MARLQQTRSNVGVSGMFRFLRGKSITPAEIRLQRWRRTEYVLSWNRLWGFDCAMPCLTAGHILTSGNYPNTEARLRRMIICRAYTLSWQDRLVRVTGIAGYLDIWLRSVHGIVHDHLDDRKLCMLGRRPPKCGNCWAAAPKSKFKIYILKIQWYQIFFLIFPSPEISHWNRRITSTLEFWKTKT
jgi:hypothetical protein